MGFDLRCLRYWPCRQLGLGGEQLSFRFGRTSRPQANWNKGTSKIAYPSAFTKYRPQLCHHHRWPGMGFITPLGHCSERRAPLATSLMGYTPQFAMYKLTATNDDDLVIPSTNLAPPHTLPSSHAEHLSTIESSRHATLWQPGRPSVQPFRSIQAPRR